MLENYKNNKRITNEDRKEQGEQNLSERVRSN